MTIRQLSDGNDDGTVLGQSATDLIGFYGIDTPVAQLAVVTTVDSTTITTCDTTVASTGLTAEATLVLMIEAHALAINRTIADVRSLAKAMNQIITKTRTTGLFASS
jgi:hypothetical protein